MEQLRIDLKRRDCFLPVDDFLVFFSLSLSFSIRSSILNSCWQIFEKIISTGARMSDKVMLKAQHPSVSLQKVAENVQTLDIRFKNFVWKYFSTWASLIVIIISLWLLTRHVMLSHLMTQIFWFFSKLKFKVTFSPAMSPFFP